MSNPFEYKLVIVVRKDLKMSAGKIAAQASHAAVICAIETKEKNPAVFNAWFTEGYKKVVLGVDSLDELTDIFKNAKEAGLIATPIIDAGRTEVVPNTMTCIGIGPAINDKFDKITGHLLTLK